MALKKNTKERSEESYWKPVFTADMVNRIRDIMIQTGLSPTDLFLKWILQEESLIGLLQSGKGQTAKQPKAAMDIPAQKEKDTKAVTQTLDHKTSGYRKELVKKAEKLRKKGMTHKKIAETFNDEKVPTVSGTGKWYSSSINILLNPQR
jgi:hypothetical protein